MTRRTLFRSRIVLELEEGVYPPSEDTDLLAEVLESLPPCSRVFEVGTGTGALSILLSLRGARVLASDRNPKAVRLSQRNASLNSVRERMDFVVGDLGSFLDRSARFPRVVFNPPYLPRDPTERGAGPLDEAIEGGEGGVEVALRFVEELPFRLERGGEALLVLSSLGDLPRFEERTRDRGLEFEILAKRSFFFEKLFVYRITPKENPIRGDSP